MKDRFPYHGLGDMLLVAKWNAGRLGSGKDMIEGLLESVRDACADSLQEDFLAPELRLQVEDLKAAVEQRLSRLQDGNYAALGALSESVLNAVYQSIGSVSI